MRTKLLLCLLVFTLTVEAQYLQHRRKHFRSSTPAATYLIEENFEETGSGGAVGSSTDGYDDSDGWTEAGTGTIDQDYSSGVTGWGSQSLRFNQSSQAGSTYATFTARTNAWAYFQFRTVSHSSSRLIASIHPSSGSGARCDLTLTSGDTLRLTVGATTADMSTTLSDATTYHIWMYYQKGTGANSIMRVWLSSDGTKPASSGTSVFREITNGTSTDDVERFYLGERSLNNATREFLFDKVRVDDEEIGSNPS